MNTQKYLLLASLLCAYAAGIAQGKQSTVTKTRVAARQLTVEPGVGFHTNFGTDLLISSLVQWNPRKRFAVASHSSFNINNPFKRSFNYVKTEYDYSLNQKFGAGTTLYGRKSLHTFMLMVGIKYTSFAETLDNPNFNKVSTSVNALSPDYGLMYSLKRGWKKYFFTGRLYLPLYPWPLKGSDINYTDGNLHNIALELGVGIKIK